MDIRLLRKYRNMANSKFYLIVEEAEYPRCRYRITHDNEEMKPRYFLCEDGEKIWHEKNRGYQATRDYEEAQKMLREQRVRYIGHLAINERIERCQKVKTRRV